MLMKKLAYMLIIISIILIVFGFYGTIKTEKVTQGHIIYFYPNFEVKKNDSKKYFTLSLYYKNNVVYQKTFIVWYIDGEKVIDILFLKDYQMKV